MNTSTESVRPNIFEYADYRAYLKDLYLHYKKETSFFSYRYFSQRAGFKSPNFLKLVIDGQRNLTEDSLSRTIKAFKMTAVEAKYFGLMVQLNQAKGLEKKSKFAKLMARSRVLEKTYPLKQAELKYYTFWYYIPLRELVGTKGFREDLNWIEDQFSQEINPDQISEALVDLQSLGLLERKEDGRLSQVHNNVTTEGEVGSTLVKNYHVEMIHKAAQSISEYSPENREISGTCIHCSSDTVQKIKQLVRDFRRDILALAEEDKESDQVFQLNFQLFPLAGVKKRGSS